jgi:maltose phosphorylase
MGKYADKYLKTDPWKIIEEGFDPFHGRVSESVFSLGNEYMGVRGYFEEDYSGDRHIGSFFNGVWEERPIIHVGKYKGLSYRWAFMVNAANWMKTSIIVEGETLDLKTSKISGFVRVLDLKNGTLTRSFTWELIGGKKIKLHFERFVSMSDHNIGGQRIAFEAINFSGTADIETGVDFDVVHEQQGGKCYWDLVKRGQTDGIALALGKTRNSGHQLFSAVRVDGLQAVNTVIFESDRMAGHKFKLQLNQGEVVGFNKVVCNHAVKQSGVDSEKVWLEGIRMAEKYAAFTYNALLEKHKAYWHQVWEKLDIVIEGDDENQQGIRFCIFQLHQTYHGQDPSNNVGAKGLTGEQYSGHTFWDSETYCLPFYMFNNPSAARNLIEYRYKTLPQALAWAKEQDCKGASFPFSTIDGTESCPVWWHGNLEIHINAAIVYAIWHYEKICGDMAFVYDEGIELLLHISRMHATRGNWSPDGGYGFYGVMGPDEFHTFVNNNAYTNVMAKFSFEYTLKVIERMKKESPQRIFGLIKQLGITDKELAEWKVMADKMIIPRDEKTGIYEQHEAFFKLPHLDIHSIPVTDFPLYDNWTLPRIYRYDMIKQPDVLLFMFFFSHQYDLDTKKVNYEYYEPRCIHESSLSPSVHSILAAELGKQEEAYEFFRYATRLDLDNYNRNTREGLHTTSIAAAWMNIVYGYGGMRSDGALLTFAPSIPAVWKSFSFRILYQGALLSVKVDKAKARFATDSKVLKIMIYGKEVTVDALGIDIELNQ